MLRRLTSCGSLFCVLVSFLLGVDASARAEVAGQQISKLLGPSATGLFGTSLAMSADGRRLIVGAPALGAAYVYVRSGVDWSGEAVLQVAQGAAERLGTAVAISDDGLRVVIGAPLASEPTTPPTTASGAVYVYLRSGSTWALEKRLVAVERSDDAHLGATVAVTTDGSRIAAGEGRAAGTSELSHGYVFSRAGTTWTEEAQLTTDAAVADDAAFANALAITPDGSRIAASATNAGGLARGAAYVFVRADTSWSQEATVVGSLKDDAAFGQGLAISADGATLAVGEPGSDTSGVDQSGAIYVFRRAASWSLSDVLVAGDADDGDHLGSSVWIRRAGRFIVAGAPGEGADADTDLGALYSFGWDGAAWAQKNKVVSSDRAPGDLLGAQVSANADATLIVGGARFAGNVAARDNGAAYVFRLSGQIDLGALGATYTQDFDGIAREGTTGDLLPLGWSSAETGTNADALYSIGNGSATAGDTRSYGTTGSGERALGGLASGSLRARFGAVFANTSGHTLSSAVIGYTAEWWRSGTANGSASRTDPLTFEYSRDATSLATGTWTHVAALDADNLQMPCHTTTTCGGVGAKNGNDPAFRHALSATVGGLAVPAGGTFWIRWSDIDSAGNDDGLGVDDLSVTVDQGAPAVATFTKTIAARPTIVGPTSAITYQLDVAVDAASPNSISQLVVSDTLPATLAPLAASDTITLTTTSGTVALTAAVDGDAGELVGNVLTVRAGDLAVGASARVSVKTAVTSLSGNTTITNSASASFVATDGDLATLTASAPGVDAVACVATPSGTIPLCPGAVSIDVVFDTDGDGFADPGEPRLAGWQVRVDAASQLTDGVSAVVFDDLAVGPHPLVVTAPSAAGEWSFDAPATVTPSSSGVALFSVLVTCTCDDDGDGDLCTRDDVCFAGECSPGPTQRDCDDHNVCTDDACAPASGCVYTANSEQCDDGKPGTKDDVCVAQACVGTAYTCTPSGPCTTSTPDGLGGCVEAAASEGVDCNDGDDGTKGDACLGGVCTGLPYSCTPGPCDATSVPNGVGCTTTPAAITVTCDDGKTTTRDDHCDGAGACAGTTYECTRGVCELSSVPNGVDCTVIYGDQEDSCDDHDPCTVNDKCAPTGGACAGSPIICGDGETCDSEGCHSTSCSTCSDASSCGSNSACVDLPDVGERCLLTCTSDDDCDDGQTCSGEAGTRYCYDADGDCTVPTTVVEPGPEADTGPEVVEEGPADPDPDVTSDASGSDADPTTATSADATSGADSGAEEVTTTKKKDDGGCAGGGTPTLWALAAALGLLARRRRA